MIIQFLIPPVNIFYTTSNSEIIILLFRHFLLFPYALNNFASYLIISAKILFNPGHFRWILISLPILSPSCFLLLAGFEISPLPSRATPARHRSVSPRNDFDICYQFHFVEMLADILLDLLCLLIEMSDLVVDKMSVDRFQHVFHIVYFYFSVHLILNLLSLTFLSFHWFLYQDLHSL